MKRILLVALACAALAGCGPQSEAKNAVKKLLNDPDSAQFSDMTPGKSDGDMCGYVNAKNRMGGYVGKTPFFFRKTMGTVAIVEPLKESDFRMLWLGNNQDDWSKVLTQCNLMDQWDAVCTFPLPQGKHELCSPLQSGAGAAADALRNRFDR